MEILQFTYPVTGFLFLMHNGNNHQFIFIDCIEDGIRETPYQPSLYPLFNLGLDPRIFGCFSDSCFNDVKKILTKPFNLHFIIYGSFNHFFIQPAKENEPSSNVPQFCPGISKDIYSRPCFNFTCLEILKSL